MIDTHANQLKQLKKLDEAAYTKAVALIENGDQEKAVAVIIEAMTRALTCLNDPIERIWREIKRLVESQEIETTKTIYNKNGLKVVLRRDRHIEKLRIFAYQNGTPMHGNSLYIGFWGRDWGRMSSAYAGKWHLVDGAEGIIKRYLAPTPVAPKKYDEYKMR